MAARRATAASTVGGCVATGASSTLMTCARARSTSSSRGSPIRSGSPSTAALPAGTRRSVRWRFATRSLRAARSMAWPIWPPSRATRTSLRAATWTGSWGATPRIRRSTRSVHRSRPSIGSRARSCCCRATRTRLCRPTRRSSCMRRCWRRSCRARSRFTRASSTASAKRRTSRMLSTRSSSSSPRCSASSARATTSSPSLSITCPNLSLAESSLFDGRQCQTSGLS
mmetsp:Transcript_49716/g.130846  ORF Transcript_49716/g.130846 Transcript_49716/m.130846 type:complete len:227 (+) Transcript_49716:1517-2197(+)